MKKIGFIGLGIMGEAMAKRLLKNGYGLVVYNKTQEKISKLGVEGVTPALSPADVAKNSELAISMLSNSNAVEEVVYGKGGIFEGMKPGFIHIDMSTISPITTKKLYDDYKERGAYFVHAPVLGSKSQAIDGSLLIFVGGDKPAVERCREILKVIGKRVWEFDSVEKATRLKLVMNSMIAMMIVALSQAFVLAERSGVSKEIVLDVLENSALNSAMYQNKGRTIMNGNFEPNFYVKHMLKDIKLVLEMAEDLKVSLPVISIIREFYVQALSKGYENEDYSAVFKVIAELAGIKI